MGSAQTEKVTESYCQKLLETSKVSIQNQVHLEILTIKEGDVYLKIIESSCQGAIQEGLSIKDYDTLFDPVPESACKSIKNDIHQLMKDYEQGDKDYVSQKLEDMCAEAVKNDDSNLSFMVEVRLFLEDLGVL